MHAGAFGSGLVGTFLVWLFLVLPSSDFSDGATVLTIIPALALALPTFYMYISLLTKDPGFIPVSNITSKSHTCAVFHAIP